MFIICIHYYYYYHCQRTAIQTVARQISRFREKANKQLEDDGRLSGARTVTHEGVFRHSVLERRAVPLCVLVLWFEHADRP